jgi:hypothetical protein
MKQKIVFLAIFAAIGASASVAGAAQIMSPPPPPPIDPGLHDIPPQVNFENRELYAAWRPIAVIMHNAFNRYYDQQRILEDRLDAIAHRHFVGFRLKAQHPAQCELLSIYRELQRQFTLYNDNTGYLTSLIFEYMDDTSDMDRRRLGSELNHALRQRTHIQIQFEMIRSRLDLGQINRCRNIYE